MNYDICVDAATLKELQYKLELIIHDLTRSTDQMNHAIQNSQEFLAGYQFEKAKRTTAECMEVTRITGNNIYHAIEYLGKLIDVLDAYGQCKYVG